MNINPIWTIFSIIHFNQNKNLNTLNPKSMNSNLIPNNFNIRSIDKVWLKYLINQYLIDWMIRLDDSKFNSDPNEIFNGNGSWKL